LTTGFYTLKEAEKHIPIVRKYTYDIVKEIKKEKLKKEKIVYGMSV